MHTAVERAGTPEHTASSDTLRLRLFAICWAVAALFHLAGNARPPWIEVSAGFVIVELGIVAAAGAVLLGRGWRTALAVLCLLIPVHAWLEAPVVGNHWVLAAIISLAYLTTLLLSARRGGGGADRAWSAFAPVARWCVLIAYAFAGFAKLNSAFFDPATSCAVYYHDQLVTSWGLGFLSSTGRPALGVAVAVAAAVTELSLPVLLVFRRTRRIGLLVALSFHWLLALDWSQHFWDFSSVLFAGFLLFADDAVLTRARGLVTTLRSAVRPSIRRVFAALGAVAIAVTVAAKVVPDSAVARVVAVFAGHGAWTVLGTVALVVVALAVARAQRWPQRPVLRTTSIALVFPVLVFANGLTPYLEIKTGFGWNMYSNLRTVAGETNHLLLPGTLDLTGLQSDRVEILASSDERLAQLADAEQEIVYSEFREYAHAYPDEAVTYRRGGETIEARRIGDDPAGQGSVSAVSHRLQSFRVVDTSGTERCQPLFTPAR